VVASRLFHPKLLGENAWFSLAKSGRAEPGNYESRLPGMSTITPTAVDTGALGRLQRYPFAVLCYVDATGYPSGVATGFTVDEDRGTVQLEVAPGMAIDAMGKEVNLIASHIRPRPGKGYDQRRYVEVWGRLAERDGVLELTPEKAWWWDEQETPFFEYSERSNPQAQKYMAALSEERGTVVKPRLSFGWLFLRTTRLPFLTATIIPILLGIAIAGEHGDFNVWLALLTLVGGACVHLGLNVANDVFDTLSGADPANVNPTPYSGGSRVIQYGLVSLKTMVALMAGFYAVAIGIGLYLALTTATLELLVIGLAGVLISLAYTAPPLKLVYRGVGEIAVAIGFGPLMVLGAYVAQTEQLSWEPFVASVPVAILIALILYINEIPDRTGDAAAGKRTLPVRFSANVITTGYIVAALFAFAVILVTGVIDYLPWPTLIALLALPLAFRVYRGVRIYYDSPYQLMAPMATNIQLHALTGLLLFAGYLLALGL
jgi:1,4-dihydroxy-2-naphthoate polyprenyltransferase